MGEGKKGRGRPKGRSVVGRGFTIPIALSDQVTSEAKTRGISASELVTEAIDSYLNKTQNSKAEALGWKQVGKENGLHKIRFDDGRTAFVNDEDLDRLRSTLTGSDS